MKTLDLKIRHDRGHWAVNEISFEMHAGGILGVAGIDGSGQRELAEAILGLRPVQAGTIMWELAGMSSRRLDRRRIGFIPPDRRAEAFVTEFSVADNLVIERSDDTQFRRAGFLSPEKMERYARQVVEDFNVICKSPEQKLRELSGGNQQKLLLGRALNTNPEVLIAMNPTWGVDVAATAAIHHRLRQMRERGGAILLISTDLEEIYALCDRFFVLHAGHLMGWATPETSTTQVGLWMAGKTGATTASLQ